MLFLFSVISVADYWIFCLDCRIFDGVYYCMRTFFEEMSSDRFVHSLIYWILWLNQSSFMSMLLHRQLYVRCVFVICNMWHILMSWCRNCHALCRLAALLRCYNGLLLRYLALIFTRNCLFCVVFARAFCQHGYCWSGNTRMTPGIMWIDSNCHVIANGPYQWA